MQESQHGAQAKVDRHAAQTGGVGGHLPTGVTDGFVPFWDDAAQVWVPGAVAGSGPAASADDPLGFGIPWTFDSQMATSSTQQVGLANRAWWIRCRGGKPGVTKIGINVAVASGNICAGVYANTGTGRTATPGARLATTGSIACPAAGYNELTLTTFASGSSVDMTNGDQWFYFSADNTTATFSASGTNGGETVKGFLGYADANFPAPDPAPALTLGTRLPWLIGV